MEGGVSLYSLSQVMVNNVSVNFNIALLRELCMIYYLPRGLASAAEFFFIYWTNLKSEAKSEAKSDRKTLEIFSLSTHSRSAHSSYELELRRRVNGG